MLENVKVFHVAEEKNVSDYANILASISVNGNQQSSFATNFSPPNKAAVLGSKDESHNSEDDCVVLLDTSDIVDTPHKTSDTALLDGGVGCNSRSVL